MINITPSPTAIQIGPFPIAWYGIGYALGLALAYLVMHRETIRKGRDPNVLANGIIIIAVAALVGGRLYHVIDQWQLYQADPIKIILPPYSGLGVYGGLITGTLTAVVLGRIWRQPFWVWADIVAPGLFAMQAVARWGNFFNQELYGAPTTLPWGIAIDCEHRVVEYPCASFPVDTTGFHPLFLYESISGVIGLLALLWIGRRFADRLRTGDLLGIFFIWYGAVRFVLESLRLNNWLFFGIPTAQIFSAAFIAVGIGIIAYRHRTPGPSTAEVDATARTDVAVAGHAGAGPEGPDATSEAGEDAAVDDAPLPDELYEEFSDEPEPRPPDRPADRG